MIWMCHFRSPFRHFSGCSPKSPSGPFRTVPQLSHINTPILATKKTVGSRNITLWYLYDIFIEFIDEQRRFFHPSISLTFLGWGHDWHGLHRGQIHWPAHFVLQCGNAKTGNDQITWNKIKRNQRNISCPRCDEIAVTKPSTVPCGEIRRLLGTPGEGMKRIAKLQSDLHRAVTTWSSKLLVTIKSIPKW